MNDERRTETTEATEIQVGDKVRLTVDDGPVLFERCGPATVLAMDQGDGDNRPSAWIRHVSQDGFFRFRSVELWDLEPAP